MKRSLKKVCVSVMIMAMFSLNVQIPFAQAAMVSTDEVVQQQFHEQVKSKVVAFLDREEVQSQLQSYGVASEDAKTRVASLSDNELQMLSDKIDQLPAGGNAVVGAAVLIFLVLLVTDILGVTDVFSFVNPVN